MVAGKLQYAVRKSRKVKDLWHGLLCNYAYDRGLMHEGTDYTKFIILGRSRVGSNLLRGYLNAHRQIITFGEIFRHTGVIGWDFSYYPRSRAMLRLLKTDPQRFLDTQVFGHFPDHIAAVGFKIFYYHAHDVHGEPVWDYLRERREVKVLHLKRRNILRTHLSRAMANASNAWKRRGSGAPASPRRPVRLDYEECLQTFTVTRQWEQQYDALFADHSKLEVIYEMLAEQGAQEMQRIQEFLGVEYAPVHAETRKQSGRRLVDSIENYDELKERFTGTPWRDFFED